MLLEKMSFIIQVELYYINNLPHTLQQSAVKQSYYIYQPDLTIYTHNLL